MSSMVASDRSMVLLRMVTTSSKSDAICTTFTRCLQETCRGSFLGMWLCWAILYAATALSSDSDHSPPKYSFSILSYSSHMSSTPMPESKSMLLEGLTLRNR